MSVIELDAQAMLAAIVRGDAVELPQAGVRLNALLEAATHHGMRALLAEQLQNPKSKLQISNPAIENPTPQSAIPNPNPNPNSLAKELVLGAALEAMRQRELRAVLDLLVGRGVRPLLLKGSALAHTLYAKPEHRPRFDTDVLVRREDMEAVAEVMAARGYSRPHQVTGELVMHQLDYARKDSHGVWHVYDFHWKLANRQVVAGMLSYDELAADACPIDALGPHARGLSPVHALVLACVHRVAHHPSDERLIWIYDIHLLTESLSPEEAESFAALAVDRSVSAVCADGIGAADRWFHTRVPATLLARLAVNQSGGAVEPSAAFLTPQGRRVQELLSDLRALPEWSRRMRLVCEHAFPPPSYMTGMYMVSNRAWLPALYTHRIIRGAWRWLRRESR